MFLRDILDEKGSTVHTIAPDASLEDLVRRLVEYNIGAMVVSRRDDAGNEQLVGIITERDLLHYCGAHRFASLSVSVSEVMTANLITGSPDDRIADVMGLMTRKRIRHLPIVSEGHLVGIISVGDIVKSEYNRLAMENRFMKEYVHS